MVEPHVTDLLGAYALHALDPQEEAVVDAHLAECPACRQEADDLSEVVPALAILAWRRESAPEGLRDRILERAAARPPPGMLSRRRRWPKLAALAAAALVVAIFATVGVLRRGGSSGIPQGRTFALQTTVPGADIRLVLADDGHAYVVASRLPDAPTDQGYQTWWIVNSTPRPAGPLPGSIPQSVHDLGLPARGAQAFAITVETGAPATPAGPPIAHADVST